MQFEIIGEIREVETIARGRGIRQLQALNSLFGRGHWRKRKGLATVLLRTGEVRSAEVHWYEAAGIGKRRIKIKEYLD
jgi:hypothetical protein